MADAAAAFTAWLTAHVDATEATAILSRARRGDRRASRYVADWLAESRLLPAVVGHDGRRAERAALAPHLRAVLAAGIVPSQVAAARIVDLEERPGSGMLWHVRTCGRFPGRALPIDAALLPHVRALARYGRTEAGRPHDPLLIRGADDARPWSRLMVAVQAEGAAPLRLARAVNTVERAGVG